MSLNLVRSSASFSEPVPPPQPVDSWLMNAAKNLSKVALPIFVLLALDALPKADGGPLSYSACCLACTVSAPPAFPACIALCSAVLFLPSP